MLCLLSLTSERYLDELQRRKGSRTKNADAEIQKAADDLDQAKRRLKEKEDEYASIRESFPNDLTIERAQVFTVAALNAKKSDQNEPEPRYV